MNKLKYLGYSIVFQEVPDEVTLAINISGCPHKCEGCHSKYLWEYEGNYISDDLVKLIEKYKGLITCVCFMGGDQNQKELTDLLILVHKYGQAFAVETLGTVAHLYTTDGMGTEDLKRQTIKDMLYILDTIEMTIVIDITIKRHKLSRRLRSGDTSTAYSLDGTLLITAVGSQFTIVECGKVGRLACFDVD